MEKSTVEAAVTPGANTRAEMLGAAFGAMGILAGVVVLAAMRLRDVDLPWHLALGRLAVARGAILRTDDLSYTMRGHPAPFDVLADLPLYLVDRVGGAVGLQILCGLLILGLAALLYLRARPARPPLRVAATALALLASMWWLDLRPVLVSFVLLEAVLLLLDRAREGASWPLFLLPPLHLVWANIHGFVVLGDAAVAGWAIYAALCRAARGRAGSWLPERDGRRAASAAVAAGATLAASCVSTIGPRIFLGPLRIGPYAAFTSEWTRTTAGYLVRWDLGFLLLAALAVAALLWGHEESVPRATLFDMGLVGGAFALGLFRLRFIAIFAVVAAPFVARRLAPVLERTRVLPVLAAAAGLALAPAVLLPMLPAPLLGAGFDPHTLPVGATDYARAHHLRGHLWNDLAFGGYIAWRLYPDVRVFIDGRTAWLYPPDFFYAYYASEHEAAALDALDARYHFDWAMVSAEASRHTGTPLAGDPRFAMVYLDDTAAIYVRRDGADAALAADAYQVLRHDTAPGLVLLRPPPAAALAHDAALAVAQAPDSPRAHFFAAAAALDAHQVGAALAERRRIAAIDPDYPGLPLLDAALGSIPSPRR